LIDSSRTSTEIRRRKTALIFFYIFNEIYIKKIKIEFIFPHLAPPVDIDMFQRPVNSASELLSRLPRGHSGPWYFDHLRQAAPTGGV